MVKEVKENWIKAGLPTVLDQAIKSKVKKLHDEYSKLRKNSNVTVFEKKLVSLFDIAATDIVSQVYKDKLRTPEVRQSDLDFLKDQREGRLQVLGSEDRKYRKKVENRAKREVECQKRKQAEKENVKDGSNITIDDGDDSDDVEDDNDMNFESKGEPSKKRKKWSLSQLSFQLNVLDRSLLNWQNQTRFL